MGQWNNAAVDIIDIFRPASEAPSIVREALLLKPVIIWMQLDISNDEAYYLAKLIV